MKIVCPSLVPTKADHAMLSYEEIEKGIRIIEDKVVDKSLTITTEKTKQYKKMSGGCKVSATLSLPYVDICIMDENGAKEDFTFLSPIAEYKEYFLLMHSYPMDRQKIAEKFFCGMQKKCAEYYRTLGVDEVVSATICTNGLLLKVLLGEKEDAEEIDYSPLQKLFNAQRVRILPYPDDFVEGVVLCESVRKKENTLLVFCDDNITLFFIDADTNTYSYMWCVDYSAVSKLALRAAIRVLRPENLTPFVYLYGEHAYDVEEIMTEEGLPFAHAEKDVYAPLSDAAFCSKLEKEKRRSSYHELLKDEDFQKEMVDLSLIMR